ncbi:MAG: NUDIX domain-containing protein [Desulfovermiculus sp.]|nr:NUDIX domain-containing protein [Desulfovermiculus sp.]
MIINELKEKVLCFERNDLPHKWLNNKLVLPIAEDIIYNKLNKLNKLWITRHKAENNEKYKQLIPYIVLYTNDKKIVCYQRKGIEKRLEEYWSIGIGGHIHQTDETNVNILNTIKNCCIREISEEIKSINDFSSLRFIAVINDEYTQVGKHHLGLLYLLNIKDIIKITTNNEISNFNLSNKTEIINYNLETWSIISIRYIVNNNII